MAATALITSDPALTSTRTFLVGTHVQLLSFYRQFKKLITRDPNSKSCGAPAWIFGDYELAIELREYEGFSTAWNRLLQEVSPLSARVAPVCGGMDNFPNLDDDVQKSAFLTDEKFVEVGRRIQDPLSFANYDVAIRTCDEWGLLWWIFLEELTETTKSVDSHLETLKLEHRRRT